MAQKIERKATTVESLKPVYLIYGDEQLLLEEAVARLKKNFSQEGNLDFNYDQFCGDKDNAGAMIQAAETLPFMSAKRLILVKDVDKLPSSDIKALAQYVSNPSPSTCLVLVAREVKKNNPLYKAAEKRGQIFEYKLPSKKEYPNWVKKSFKDKGQLATDNAARLLIDGVGYNLSRLSNEIEKISLFYKDRAEISEEDVSALVCQSCDKNIFDLVDSMSRKDANSALVEFKHLVEEGGDPPQLIFHMIVRQFRLLIKTKSLVDRDLTDQAISKELKIPFFVAKKLRQQARNFSAQKLQAIYGLLAEVDLALKTSEREPKLLLEDLLVRVME